MDDTRVGIDHFRLAMFEQAQDIQDAQQDVGGFEAGDGDGPVQFARKGAIGGRAHDGANMAGGEEGVRRGCEIGADGAEDGRHEELRHKQADISQAALLGLVGQHGVGGRRGLEADGEMDDLLVRILFRKFERLEGRGDHTDIGAVGLGGIKIALRGGGHAEQIAEGANDGVRAPGNGNGVVEVGGGRDAYGAARAVQKLHMGRQERIECVAQDGVGLAAADFHDPCRAFRDPRNLRRQSMNAAGIGIFGQMLHESELMNS